MTKQNSYHFSLFFNTFVAPTLIRGVQSIHIDFTITFPFPQITQDWMLCFISLVISLVSMIISLKIYAKKDL